jgi:hypothetical protein
VFSASRWEVGVALQKSLAVHVGLGSKSAVSSASAPELRQPVVALSLGGLQRRIEIAMLPDDVRIVLQLDGLAERERHRRLAQAQPSTR